MKIYMAFAILFGLLLTSFAQAEESYRKMIFSNDQVNTWHMVVYPGSIVKMHPHAYNYLAIPTESGKLKLTTNTNKVTYVDLEKEKSRAMSRLPDQVTHTVENLTDHPIKITIIELKKD